MIRAIDHINIVVNDLPAMTRFYTDVLGMKVTKQVTISGDWIDRVVGLSGAKGEVIYLELPAGPRVELIRYVSPAGANPAGMEISNTRGIRHIAFTLDDIESMFGHLQRAGVKTLSDIQIVPDSQVTYAGGVRKRLVYFRDPEGNLLELCEYQ